MGSYTFTWEHPASEVYVTGDFDAWKQTIKLENDNGVFKKTVEIPKARHQYKFVVDGKWVLNDSHPKSDDGQGNVNNVLTEDDIKDETVATLSSAAPASTTAALAGLVPKEKSAAGAAAGADDHVPGAFPLTPPVATPGSEPQAFSVNPIPATEGAGNPIKLAPGEPVPDPSTLTSNTIQSTVKDGKPEEQAFGVAPIPATEGAGNPIKLAPGEPVPDPSTLTSNTIQSTVKDDKPEEQAFGVAPIPATAGAGNPIQLAPGEKVPDPSTLTSNTVESTVKTDAASYEKSDALPPQAPSAAAPEAKQEEAKGGMFSLPPVTGSLIPESSLPKDTNVETEKDPGVTIQSAAPTSTTAALAGQVPKEPKDVPAAVTESQKEAKFPPEASANAEAVEEKKEVEQELKEKVPEEPATSDGSASKNIAAGAAAGAAATAGAFAAATYAAKDKAATAVGLNGQATATASDVPDVVAESQKEAHASPEASANKEAVEEKKEVESELLKEVKKTDEAGEPAPTATAATTATAPGLSDDALADSKPLSSSSEPDALNATAATPAQPESQKAALAQPEETRPVDSRDVSPMSKQPTKAETEQPIVTTGAESSKVDAKSDPFKSSKPATETPKADAPSSAQATPASVGSSATGEKKKKNRLSFFGKIKEKLKH